MIQFSCRAVYALCFFLLAANNNAFAHGFQSDEDASSSSSTTVSLRGSDNDRGINNDEKESHRELNACAPTW
eukprot:CAMPEP_0116549946 /NCGR_PEP_ID=MMETSP0397-20121206/5158_1 /TAXON_ID=216820 /ORGANISM="Cyclophora tenuis, Strain ECT3854" /LENGTH=71 /DNA_ID=CAMNT_0004074731 /DNA_START=296 /DNA_END=508 /DNA_ORIENTATION=-